MLNEAKLELLGSARRVHLAKQFPLFAWDFEKNRYARRSWSKGFTVQNGDINWQYMVSVRHDHGIAAIEEALTTIYPHLMFSANMDRDGISLSTWVLRDGRDCESFNGRLFLHDPALHPTLAKHEQSAIDATREGWFFCTGHGHAVESHKGQYFYFAGRYCKRYGDEHPEHRTMAAKEDYN